MKLIREVCPKIDGYGVFSKLGQGFFGDVYAYHEIGGCDKFALKIIPYSNPRFTRIMSFFGGQEGFFNHESLISFENVCVTPNLMPSEVIKVNGISYLKMPVYDSDLNKFIGQNNVDEDNFYIVAGQIIAGLAQLHSFNNGYVHFDLKPDCVFINKTDLGLKCVLGDFGGVLKMGNLKVGVGSRDRASPQNSRGILGPQNDVNLVGKILFEMMLGFYPGKSYADFHLIADAGEKIRDFNAGLITDSLEPTSYYKKLVDDSLGQLPEYSLPIQSLMKKAMFEEIPNGVVLLNEFESLSKYICSK